MAARHPVIAILQLRDKSMQKLIQRVEADLDTVRQLALQRGDGNTVAVINAICRQTALFEPFYKNLPIDAEVPSEEGDETKDNFTAASYEKTTGAKDVNKPALPPTGEHNQAPFLSKADMEVGPDGTVKFKPGANSPQGVEVTQGPGGSTTIGTKDDPLAQDVQLSNQMSEKARLEAERARGDEGAGQQPPIKKKPLKIAD